MLHPLYETWKRCAVCGVYSFTDAQRCTNHEQPAPLLLISDRQLARVTTMLEKIRDRLPADELREFGLFALGLEEANDRPCPSEAALLLFRQQREHRLGERMVES